MFKKNEKWIIPTPKYTEGIVPVDALCINVCVFRFEKSLTASIIMIMWSKSISSEFNISEFFRATVSRRSRTWLYTYYKPMRFYLVCEEIFILSLISVPSLLSTSKYQRCRLGLCFYFHKLFRGITGLGGLPKSGVILAKICLNFAETFCLFVRLLKIKSFVIARDGSEWGIRERIRHVQMGILMGWEANIRSREIRELEFFSISWLKGKLIVTKEAL